MMASNRIFFTTLVFVLVVTNSIAQYTLSALSASSSVSSSESSSTSSTSTTHSSSSSSGGSGFKDHITSAFNSVRNGILNIIKTPNKFVSSCLKALESGVDRLPELVDKILSAIGDILKIPPGLLDKIIDTVMSGIGKVYDYIGSAGSTVSRYETKVENCFSNNSNNPVVKALEGFADCLEKQVSDQSDKLDSTIRQAQNVVDTLITQIDQVQNVSGLGKTVNGLVDTAQAEIKEILPTVFSVIKLVLSLVTAIPGYGTCSLGVVVKEPSTTYSFVKEFSSCVAK